MKMLITVFPSMIDKMQYENLLLKGRKQSVH